MIKSPPTNITAPLIYVGYGRSGSTSIRAMLREPWTGLIASSSQTEQSFKTFTHRLSDSLLLPKDYEFDAHGVRTLVAEELGQASDLGKIPVLATLRFAGHWHSGGYDARLIAERLHACWPQARIFICFREQHKILSSAFRHYLEKGGTQNFETFFNPPPSQGDRLPTFSWKYYRYLELITLYQSLFGKSAVLSIPFEQMISAPLTFFKRVATFAGAQHGLDEDFHFPHLNEGPNAFQSLWIKHMNRLMRHRYMDDDWQIKLRTRQSRVRITAKLAQAFGTQTSEARAAEQLDSEIAKCVRDRYDLSNQELGSLLNIDLAALGYRVAASNTA